MNETIKEHSWIPLIVVAFASFIIALDSTFMNVSFFYYSFGLYIHECKHFPAC